MIEEKRAMLEGFIREQTLGPGASGTRFVDLQSLAPQQTMSDVLSSEVLNTVPGVPYSTGILFPVDDTKGGNYSNQQANDSPPTESNPIASLPEEEDIEVELEEEDAPVEQQSLNQMYPNSMGMTLCLDRTALQTADLDLTIKGRYYRKIDLTNHSVRPGVLLEQDVNVFRSFLEALPANDIVNTSLEIETGADGATYLTFRGSSLDVPQVKSRAYAIKREYFEQFKLGERNFPSFDKLKEGLFDELRRKVIPSSEEGMRIISKLDAMELVENFLMHILDLMSIYDATGYGAWKCETFQCSVPNLLPHVGEGKTILGFNRFDMLKDIFRVDYAPDKWAALSINLQYNDHVPTGRIFLKIQLVNTSKHFDAGDTRNGRNFFSMASEEINRRSFFGVAIVAESKHLISYRDLKLPISAEYSEDDINRYIYREYTDFAVGHGCSVKWWRTGDTWSVSTEYLPTCETPDIDPTPRRRSLFEAQGSEGFIASPIFGNASFFQFKWLSTLSSTTDEDVLRGLDQFVDAYESWIHEQEDVKHPNMSSLIRARCQLDADRLRQNIIHLRQHQHHLQCFRLMNTAMFMQLWHGAKKKEVLNYMQAANFEGFFESFYRERTDINLFGESTPAAAWRPFQLAFILLNIDGVFQRDDDPEWKARNAWVDLVWFPTGGGKTEAYLGLIALTILNRRRTHGASGGGTAVIMRYTLRLLTAQQFQRATLLIMALELIRRWNPHNLGEEPIYVGLFVGKGSLPNKLTGDSSLFQEFENLLKAQKEKRSTRTKIPIRQCPCCGNDLNPVQFSYISSKKHPQFYNRILLSCSDQTRKCAFYYKHEMTHLRSDQGPIPVSLCDEEIYQHPPALLFGTVDKFAQIAHKINNLDGEQHADSRRLFGKGKWEKGKPQSGYLTPDMIIQDELHLMVGPLGSAVALFESAIEQLCTREVNGIRIRPKIISSTATTRNTDFQIMALFNRKVNLFPKPGIYCDDSFFAFFRRAADSVDGDNKRYLSKRKYLGVLPTGRTQMWMQLRLAAIAFTHRAVFEVRQLTEGPSADSTKYTEALCRTMDYYHTVLTYFNSLREVGKTESQVFTYLVKETRRVFNKVLRPAKLMHCFYTYNSSFRVGELTGRLSGEEIVDQMNSISSAWSANERMAHSHEESTSKGNVPPDLVIATNMISVGIDISRFNTMIVNCMPRNIAEYIQASSRVARNKQGLVITVHHPFRSRDISHYEKFIEFHEKMYSYVEPISITPFTRKALERYLPLYIATILRHTMPAFTDRKSAHTFLTEDQYEAVTNCLIQYFSERETSLQKDDTILPRIKDLLTSENLQYIDTLIKQAIREWQAELTKAVSHGEELVYNNKASTGKTKQRQLYVDIDEYQDNIHSELWRIPQSLRVVDPEAVIHIEPK